MIRVRTLLQRLKNLPLDGTVHAKEGRITITGVDGTVLGILIASDAPEQEDEASGTGVFYRKPPRLLPGLETIPAKVLIAAGYTTKEQVRADLEAKGPEHFRKLKGFGRLSFNCMMLWLNHPDSTVTATQTATA